MRRIASKWLIISAIAAAVIVAIGGVAALRSRGGSVAIPVDDTICTTCVGVAGPGTSPVLYPGAAPSSMPVTFTNTTDGPIYLTSLAVKFTNSFPSTCSVSNYHVGDTTPQATVEVSGATTTIKYSPAQTISAGATWTDDTTLSMPDTHENQGGCQKVGLSMSYTGTANYTVMTTTALSVASDPNTDTATLTATVAPDIQPASAGHTPGTGDGEVTFYYCSSNTSASSCKEAIGTAPVGPGGVATISIPAGSVGSYNLVAVYAPSDPTSFVTSTSPIVTDTLSGCVTTQTAGAATVLKGGQTYNGNLTVNSGGSLWLDGGTINGNVTVLGSGQFAATGGTVNGNIQSSGGPTAIAGTIVTGNVSQQNGGLSLGPATNIKGNAQVSGGGPFCSQGASKALVQIKLNLTVQGLTSSTTASVCATNVGNNLQWQQNGSSGVIGACGGDKVLGNLLVQNNSGKVTIGATGTGNGNTVSGNINVSGNTGGGTITGNSANGNCQLTGDKPGIVGSSNTTGKGNNQCNTGSAGA